MLNSILNTVNQLTLNSILKLAFGLAFVVYAFCSFKKTYAKVKEYESRNTVVTADFIRAVERAYNINPFAKEVNEFNANIYASYFSKFNNLIPLSSEGKKMPINNFKAQDQNLLNASQIIGSIKSKAFNSIDGLEIEYEKYTKSF